MLDGELREASQETLHNLDVRRMTESSLVDGQNFHLFVQFAPLTAINGNYFSILHRRWPTTVIFFLK